MQKVYLRETQNNRSDSQNYISKASDAWAKLMLRKDLGFWQVIDRDSLWQKSTEWGSKIRQKYSDIVVLGIGGSSLGGEFISELGQKHSSSPKVHFCDNVDPWLIRKIQNQIPDFTRCFFLVISKSGTTLETLTVADIFIDLCGEQKINFAHQALVITEPTENSLSKWAKQNQVPQLELPVDVGGRFSILTPVGLVLAEAMGLSVSEIRAGAREALKSEKQIQSLVAQALASFDRQEWITFLWNYSSALKYFGLWFEQLWAESLAKKIDRQKQLASRVSTPISAVGTCDQHSLLQQVMEGEKDKWVIQIRVADFEKGGIHLKKSNFSALDWRKAQSLGEVLGAEAQATFEALSQNNVSMVVYELRDLSPDSVGFLLMFWQLVVGCLGEALDIDAFNQPGVELGKRLAKEILQKSVARE